MNAKHARDIMKEICCFDKTIKKAMRIIRIKKHHFVTSTNLSIFYTPQSQVTND